MAGVFVYDTMKNFLETQFSGVYRVLDFDEIDETLQQSSDKFLVLEEVISDEDNIGIGDPVGGLCVREFGNMLIHCFSPAPHASNETRRMADEVRDALRHQNVNGVRVTDIGAPDPGARMNDGLWNTATLFFEYNWDTYYP